MDWFPPLHHQSSHFLDKSLLVLNQGLNWVNQVFLHFYDSFLNIPMSPLEVLDCVVPLIFFLPDQIPQPTLLRFQLVVFVHLFIQVAHFRRRWSTLLVEFCYCKGSVWFVRLQFLENLTAFVEVGNNRSTVILQIKTVGESRFWQFVTVSDFSVDVASLEWLEVVVIGHSVVLELLSIEGNLAKWAKVVKGPVIFSWVYLEIGESDEVEQNLLLADELGGHEDIHHVLQLVLAIVEESLIHPSEIW